MSRMIKKSSFFIFFIVLNIMLSFVIEPARSASGLMWESYYEQEQVDMIFVGSSLCQGSFDTYIFDEHLGVNSFNMGTPLQAVPQSIRAIETAIEEHDIQTVIFGMSFATLKTEEVLEAEMTFEKSRIREKGMPGSLIESIRYLWSDGVRDVEKSFLFFFPWMYNRGELSKTAIIENVSLKLRQLKEKYFHIPIEDHQIYHKGFQNHDGVVFNYDNVWETNSYRYYGANLDDKMMESLEELIKLCKRQEIDLIVINTPHPYFDVISCYEYYEKNHNEVKALCSSYGVDYYDFSLAKPEIFDVKAEHFSDYEHMNLAGAKIFSRQLCDFLIRRANGENLEACFYSFDEFFELHASWLDDWKSYAW